ncbi:MAG TPA: LamG domain-containing protein, partial [Ktedonobacteraceae bacterium]
MSSIAVGPDTSYASVILADNPIAYWRLEEQSPPTFRDQVAGRDMTSTGTPVLTTQGALAGGPNTCATFDGTALQYLSNPFDAALNVVAPFSVEVWCKLAYGSGVTSNYRALFSTREIPSPYKGFTLFSWLNTGAFNIQWSNGSTLLTYGHPLVPNRDQWYHVVGYHNGTGGGVMVNGNFYATYTFAYVPATTGSQTIGISGDLTSYRFAGSIDEVALYNYVLTPAQALAHYNAGLWYMPASEFSLPSTEAITSVSPRVQITVPVDIGAGAEVSAIDVADKTSYQQQILSEGPSAYWKCDELSGNKLVDQVSRRDLTLYGTPPIMNVSSPLSAGGGSAVGFIDDPAAQYAEYLYQQGTLLARPAPISFEAWIRWDGNAVGQYRYFCGQFASGAFRGVGFVKSSADQLYVFWGNGTAQLTRVMPTTMVVGKWYHCVFTHDGGNGRFYVNGVQISVANPSQYAPCTVADNTPLRLASNTAVAPSPAYNVAGAYDEIAIYPYVLSQEQVQSHYSFASQAAYQDLVLSETPI